MPIVIAAVMFFVFRSTRWGYEVDMIGGNPRAAEFAGIRVTRRIVVVMLISGAIAGLSGMLHLAGPAQRLNSSISNNYGLSGFIVAALAGSSVIGVVVGAVFIAGCCMPGSRCRPTGCRCSSSPPCTGWCCSASPSVRRRRDSASCGPVAGRSARA